MLSALCSSAPRTPGSRRTASGVPSRLRTMANGTASRTAITLHSSVRTSFRRTTACIPEQPGCTKYQQRHDCGATVKIEPFLSCYQITAKPSSRQQEEQPTTKVPEVEALQRAIGGCTFDHGIYRVLRGHEAVSSASAIGTVFPELLDRALPFGYDWLGRHFAVDLGADFESVQSILMIEVGAGEVMEIPASLEDFHNEELVRFADASLSLSFWREWRASNPHDLPFESCVGYKIPLFLGGVDEIENLEIIDLGVYVELCGQLRNKVRHLPLGQTIRSIAFRDTPRLE